MVLAKMGPLLLLLALGQAGASIKKTNVLFMVVDNLRPSLGAYGVQSVLSPHIDELAAADGATLFSRAYCQEAWCSPSRNS